MFEHAGEKLLPRDKFFLRMAKYLLLSLSLIAASMVAGMVGYMSLGGLGLVDAFMNSAMIMGGMGPVDLLRSDSAKIFAGLYALWCGFVELIAVGIFAAPIAHRVLHRFHLEGRDG
jgi:hypothetical protein